MTNKERAEALRRAGEHLISDANRCKSYSAEGVLRIDGKACCEAADFLERLPDMRPMRWQEAVATGRPVYAEAEREKDQKELCEAGSEWQAPETLKMLAGALIMHGEDIDEVMRFWPDKPTKAQSKEWPWEVRG